MSESGKVYRKLFYVELFYLFNYSYHSICRTTIKIVGQYAKFVRIYLHWLTETNYSNKHIHTSS